VRRIRLGAGFRDLLAAGIAPEQAVFVLRRLRLYRGGIEIGQNDVHIDYNTKTKGLWITPALTLGGPVRLPGPGPIEVDADQVKKLIAKLRKPLIAKPRKQPGRHRLAGRQLILDEYDRLVREREEKPAQGAHVWAAEQVKQGKLQRAPHPHTIERWVRERNEIQISRN
jgi:hypothetical protein